MLLLRSLVSLELYTGEVITDFVSAQYAHHTYHITLVSGRTRLVHRSEVYQQTRDYQITTLPNKEVHMLKSTI